MGFHEDVTRHYDFLAEYWDSMYADTVPYATAFTFIDDLRAKLDLGKAILDVACGTGLLLGYFEDAEYETRGSDLSQAMLAHARARLTSTQLWEADYHEVTCAAPVDVIVSFFNSFSYCLSGEDLTGVLVHLRELLVPGGVIVFDIATTNEPEEVFNVKTYIFPGECMSRTFFGVPRDGVFNSQMIFTIFDRTTSERRIITQETNRGIFSHDAILECITNAGLSFFPAGEGYMPETETFVARNPVENADSN